MKKNKLFLCALLPLIGSVQAQEEPRPPLQDRPAAEEQAPAQPTVITAEHLVFDYENAFAIFDDNVVVEDRDMNLTADKLTVRFDEDNQVTYIEAKGNVVIKQEDRIAESERATYSIADGKITLTENPQIQQGLDIIQGEEIVFWRDQSRMVVDKPRVLIMPKDGEAPNVLP